MIGALTTTSSRKAISRMIRVAATPLPFGCRSALFSNQAHPCQRAPIVRGNCIGSRSRRRDRHTIRKGPKKTTVRVVHYFHADCFRCLPTRESCSHTSIHQSRHPVVLSTEASSTEAFPMCYTENPCITCFIVQIESGNALFLIKPARFNNPATQRTSGLHNSRPMSPEYPHDYGASPC